MHLQGYLQEWKTAPYVDLLHCFYWLLQRTSKRQLIQTHRRGDIKLETIDYMYMWSV